MEANFYLKKLIIQNFATFKNQNISFKQGFNAIVGETGSGKSLVLDALQLILGGRADKKVVRRETEYSLIEARFHCSDPSMQVFLEQEGYPIDGHELIIKRLIYRNGVTKNYINHLSCTVSFLATFAKRYIDIVGQFENQRLLSGTYQLHLLDQFAKLHEQTKDYQALLQDYKSLKSEEELLSQSKNHRDQRLDYLTYQLQEIEKLNPSSQDEDDLIQKKHLMLNFEKTMKLGFQINEFFDGGESQEGILNLYKSLSSLLRKNLENFPISHEVVSDIEDKLLCLKQEIEGYLNTEIDPSELEGVLERLDLYQKLKKKFGGSVESILQTQVEFLKERKMLEELEVNLGEISQKINKALQSLHDKAQSLHQKRLKHSVKLGEELTKRIRALKMVGATIRMELQEAEEFYETGITKAYFIAETNKGEGFFKIKDTASGGELSRILLGLRQILSSYDSISIFLFDEIDTGIGGETATCIGKALTEVAANGQVIAITHLPQIAQYAENLILVNKEIQQNDKEARTESSVREIYGKMILKEVKAMAQLS